MNGVSVWAEPGLPDAANTALFLRGSADQRIGKLVRGGQGLNYAITEIVFKPGENAVYLSRLFSQLK